MQDFTSYQYDMTIDQLREAQKVVKDITIIINGEYYTLIDDTPKDRNITHHLQVERG